MNPFVPLTCRKKTDDLSSGTHLSPHQDEKHPNLQEQEQKLEQEVETPPRQQQPTVEVPPWREESKYCVTYLLTVSRHMYRTCSSDFSPDILSLNLFLWALLLSSSSSSSPLEDAPPAANAAVARREDEEQDMASLKCRDFEALREGMSRVMPGRARKSWTGRFWLYCSYLYPHG